MYFCLKKRRPDTCIHQGLDKSTKGSSEISEKFQVCLMLSFLEVSGYQVSSHPTIFQGLETMHLVHDTPEVQEPVAIEKRFCVLQRCMGGAKPFVLINMPAKNRIADVGNHRLSPLIFYAGVVNASQRKVIGGDFAQVANFIATSSDLLVDSWASPCFASSTLSKSAWVTKPSCWQQ